MGTQITGQKVLAFDNYAAFGSSTGIEGYIYIDNDLSEAYLWDADAAVFVLIGADTPIPPDPTPLTFVDAATTGILSFLPNYSNGTLGVGATLTATQVGVLRDTSGTGRIDASYIPVVGGLVLVKNQALQYQNGIYVITTVGSPNPGGTFYQLTRVADFDQASELFPLQVNVLQGTVNANQYFNQATPSPLVIGTSNLVFNPAGYVSPTGAIAFVDVATTTALPACTYANGTLNPSFPGLNATLTANSAGSVLTVDGLTASTSATPLGTFTRVLVKDQANKAHNGDYIVVNPGSATASWQLRRINYSATGFYRFSRYFLVSNTQASLAGRIYITKKQDPALSNLGIGTQLIDLVEYGGSSSVGPFGIANSSGVYTYYTTMTLAMAAAGAGTNKTIEMFADVTETSVATITFPTGVTLNGNGHTYTFDTAGTVDVFNIPAFATCYLYDININLLTSIGSVIKTNNDTTLIGNATLISNSGSSYIVAPVGASSSINISGFTIVAKLSKNGVQLANGSYATNLTIYSETGEGLRVGSSAKAFNCNVIASNPSNYAAYVFGYLANSVIYSYGGSSSTALGLQGSGSSSFPTGVYNCNIISLLGHGVFLNDPMDVDNTTIITYGTGKYAVRTDINASTTYTDFFNCTLKSINGPCVEQLLRWLSFTNCYLYAGAGSAIDNTGPNPGYDVIRLRRCFIEVAGSNASYHGVVLGTDNGSEITNCYFSVVNASSYAITALGAITAKCAQNAFKGTPVPINPLVTNISNLIDTQGNVII